MKQKFFSIVVLFLFVVSVSPVRAGTLDSLGSLAPTGYTLDDIYERLTTNATAVSGDHSLSPSSDPTPTFSSLSDIYGAIPTIFPDTVKDGTSYLGVTGTLLPNGGTASVSDLFSGSTAHLDGDWTLDTGTLTLACATETFDGSSNLVGDLYDGNGDGSDRFCMTASGDAGADEILAGRIAWVDGVPLSGSMVDRGAQTIIPTASDQAIAEGFHNGLGIVEGDSDLISANIRAGVNLFGINGDSDVVDTSSGTASADQILDGEIAYVDGAEITGTFASQEKTANTEGEEIEPDSGNWLSKVTVAITNLLPGNIKKGITVGGVVGTAESGFPGSGWEPEASGDGSVALNQEECNDASDWEWFEDGNGDGDTSDSGDGVCVKVTTENSDSWNGAKQVTPNNLGDTTATSGTANSVTRSGAGWSEGIYESHIAKIMSGTASGCWGIVKTNTADTITVYGSWLSSGYASDCGVPDATSHFAIFDDAGQYDNSFLGDYTCEGDFPNGTVVHHSYPTSGVSAIETADCYDGRRDLLPEEVDRAILSGGAESVDATTLTDTDLQMEDNLFVGQKLLITGGTGEGSYGRIESHTETVFTVESWSGDTPDTDSQYALVYVIPHPGYNPNAYITGGGNNPKGVMGPLRQSTFESWQGTRLPTADDFFGFCGYKDGGSDYETGGNALSADKSYGNHGGQSGRTDELWSM
jgi:hypothetical protein